MNEDSLISMLEHWYSSKCDGDWEHTGGVSLTTLDNPGWLLEFKYFDWEAVDLSKVDELNFGVIGEADCAVFSWDEKSRNLRIFCGPKSLSKALKVLVGKYGKFFE